jgi:hypothetical protein
MTHPKTSGRILVFAVAAALEAFLTVRNILDGDTIGAMFFGLATALFAFCLIITIDNRRISRRAEQENTIRGYLPPRPTDRP